MKLIKRIGSILLMLLIVFTMLPAGTVSAEVLTNTGSLTILDEKGNIKNTFHYSAYQIATFDASRDSGGTTFYTNMKINSAYKATLMAATSLTGSPTDKAILSEVTKLNANQMAALAIELQKVANLNTADATTTNGKFNSLVNGYYLVIETVNDAQDGTVISKPILVSVPNSSGIADVTVNVKTSKAGIEKKIIEKKNNDTILVDSSTAAVGDIVKYQSTSDIPSYPTYATGVTYYVTDTFSQGLTFDASSVIAQIVPTTGSNVTLNLGTDYTLETTGIGTATFRLTLKNSDDIIAWGNAGSKLLVTYNATVNEKASYGITGNPNSIKLTYSKVPGEYTTKEDTVITYTEILIVTKVDKDGGNALSGATFALSKLNSSGTYDVIDTQTTDVNGKAYFKKLEQGTYKLKETAAPAGYDLLNEETIFVVTAQNNSIDIPNTSIICTEIGNTDAADKFKATWICDKFTVNNDGSLITNIENSKGFVLPGTGGRGTKIFTFSGIAIILLGCGMVFIYLKKKNILRHQ